MERGGSSAGHRRLRGRGGASSMRNRQEGGGEGQTVREQDWFMPMTNLIRIMRRVLPGHAKISDDAKETVQDCVSEYISIVTREANRRCQLEQRKTITADDVLWAMRKLGLDDYVEPLSVYLHKFREAEQAPSSRPVIRKEAGPVNGGGFLHHSRHLQQLPHAMRGGGHGAGFFYKDFGNTGGPGGGGLF